MTLILGGARSGKSRLAQKLAAEVKRVYYVATALPGDDAEMIHRIARRRVDRPDSWQTIEEPLALAEAAARSAAVADTIIMFPEQIAEPDGQAIDGDDPACIEEIVRSHLRRIVVIGGSSRIIIVSNDVGCGTVPEAAVACVFRDTPGLLSQWVAEAADEVILAVAGLRQYLKSSTERGAAS